MGDMTEFFSIAEFGCKCGCLRVSADWRLVTGLTQLRRRVGVPVRVWSGFRCVAHNSEVGGMVKSYHRIGAAADVQGIGVSLLKLYSELEEVPLLAFGGVGLYPTLGVLHVDVRRERARWGKIDGELCTWHDAVSECVK